MTVTDTGNKAVDGRHAASSMTREKILDASEVLFIERGYEGTSLRAIAASADVNLAATHYHFGSKEKLFAATIHRRVVPINDARIRTLDELADSGRPETVHNVMTAFFQPFLSGEMPLQLTRLFSRLYGEPADFSKALLEREFGEVADRYIQALGRALPEVSEDELRWRFHFTIGAMIHLLGFETPVGVESGRVSMEDRIRKLKNFVVAGFLQGRQEVEGGRS